MKTLAVVAAVGVRTPIGLNAIDTGFLYRAGAAAMRQPPLLDHRGESITMCYLPTLDPRIVGVERAIQLAVPALDEALSPLAAQLAVPGGGSDQREPEWTTVHGGPRARRNAGTGPAGRPALRTKLFVCMDEVLGAARGDGMALGSSLLSALQHRAKTALQTEVLVESNAQGAAGPGFLLPKVFDELTAGTVDIAVLGGVHTDYDPAIISALSRAERLYSNENLNSLIAGESAAFVLLTRPELARRIGLGAHASLQAVATGFEKARWDNDEPAFEAAGLTTAVRKATEDLRNDGLRAGWVFNDLSFEMFRLHEWQAVTARVQDILCEPQQVESPAQRMGQLGAAAIPLFIALAAEGWQRGYAPHDVALACAGSDAGERAALVMSRG